MVGHETLDLGVLVRIQAGQLVYFPRNLPHLDSNHKGELEGEIVPLKADRLRGRKGRSGSPAVVGTTAKRGNTFPLLESEAVRLSDGSISGGAA